MVHAIEFWVVTVRYPSVSLRTTTYMKEDPQT